MKTRANQRTNGKGWMNSFILKPEKRSIVPKQYWPELKEKGEQYDNSKGINLKVSSGWE